MGGKSGNEKSGGFITANDFAQKEHMLRSSEEHDIHLPFSVSSWLRPSVSAVIVFAAAVLCFCNSYDGQFVFDDAEAIEGNQDLLPEAPVTALLYHDFWGNKLSNTSHKSYRPLTVLTFRWSYWLAGGLHPLNFHVVNIVLHGVVCVLLLPVFDLVFSHGSLGNALAGRGAPVSALCCTLLFAVHPVHTENVSAIVGRADLLCALFYIPAFLFYIQGATASSSFRPETHSILPLLISVLLCALATFSKELGITVIGICSVYDILIVCGVDIGVWLGLRSSSSSSQSSSNGTSLHQKHSVFPPWVLALIKRQLILFAAAVFLLVIRWRVMGSSPPTFQVVDNPHSFVNGSLFRMLNYNYLYAINAWLLLSPHWLCFDWSMGCVPTITSLDDPRLVAVALLWLVLALLAWTCLCGNDNSVERRIVTMATAMVVIPFLPASNLLFRVGFVVAERVLYLPSMGFCVIVVMGLRKLCQRSSTRNISCWCFLLLLVIFTCRSVQRSNEWRVDMWLFKSGERICPNNAKIHYNIGKVSGDVGNNTEAVACYRKAIQLFPEYDQAMNNLANILKDEGQELEAETLLNKAVNINPRFAAAWMNRGIVKAALKKFDEAEYSYQQGIKNRRNYPDCYYNLGNLYTDMNRTQDALLAYQKATSLKSTHWNAWHNSIIVLDNLQMYSKAAEMAHTALKFLPDNAAIMSTLGGVYGKDNKLDLSVQWYLEAIKRNPSNFHTHLNLGVAYHRWNKFDKAKASYHRALQLDPHNQAAVEYLNMLENKMKSRG